MALKESAEGAFDIKMHLVRSVYDSAVESEESSASPSGGGGPDVYYYSNASDTGTLNPNSNYWYGCAITCTLAGSITTIGFKINGVADEDARLGLYYNNGGTWTLVTGSCKDVSAEAMTDGWNDISIDTPYSVDALEIVRIFLVSGVDHTGFDLCYKTEVGAAPYIEGGMQACIATPTIAMSDNHITARVFVT